MRRFFSVGHPLIKCQRFRALFFYVSPLFARTVKIAASIVVICYVFVYTLVHIQFVNQFHKFFETFSGKVSRK